MVSTKRTTAWLSVALLLASLLPLGNAALAAYGTIASATTPGLTGTFTATFASAQIVYIDGDSSGTPTGSSGTTTETLYLDLNGNGQVDLNEVQIYPSAGTLATTTITTSVCTGTSTCTGGTALKNLLKFKDTLPAYADGGPDGKFNPGETLFLDLNSPSTGILDAGDIILSPSVSRQASTDTDATWNCSATTLPCTTSGECIYSGTATGNVVVAGLRRVTLCGAFAAGTTTAGGDADVTAASPLTTFSSIYVTGTDANVDAGETSYVGSGSTVTSGLYRLSKYLTGAGCIANCPAGSATDCSETLVTSKDADCGLTLNAVSSGLITFSASTYKAYTFPAVKWLDLDGDGTFGAGVDRLYFDGDANGVVSPADTRISTASSATFGSRPALGDLETHAAALLGTLTSAQLIYQDSATNVGQVDATESVAFDLDGDGHFDFGDVPLLSLEGCTAGLARTGTTTCGTTGTWKTGASATTPLNLCYHDDAGNGPTRGDGLYAHRGACTTTVSANDVRITQSIVGGVSYAGGALVPSTGSDVGSSLTAVTLGTTFTLHVYDIDGSGSVTQTDPLYVEVGSGNAAANPKDARLNSVGGTFGAYLSEVASTDKDAVIGLTAITPAFGSIDMDNSGGLSLGDPIYLTPTHTCPTVLTATDVHLSPGRASEAAGTNLGASAESGIVCSVISSVTIGFVPSNQAYSSASTLFAHFGAGTTVSVGDVRIGGTSAGTKVNSADTFFNNAFTTKSVTYGYVDLNGDGALQTDEPIVIDADGNSLWSAGDAVLQSGVAAATTTTGGGGGTVVTSTTVTPTPTPTTTTTATNTSTTTGALDLAAINKALQASMTVTRDGENNVVKWTLQPGVMGYQVWSHDSPWALVLNVDASTNTIVQHASASTHYLVTAYTSEATKLTDINTQSVPGLGVDPDGAGAGTTTTSGKGAIPAPSLLVGLGAVAVALALARRRLA